MLNTFEFPDGFRAAAELRGFRFGHGRQPLSNAQEQDRTRAFVRVALHHFGLRPGRSAAAGCALRKRDTGQDKIAQVVQEVLAVLDQRGII